jgi:hypothetical protein
VVRLRVGDCRREDFLDLACSGTRREREHGASFRDGTAPNVLNDEARLARRDAQVLRRRAHLGALLDGLGSRAGHR